MDTLEEEGKAETTEDTENNQGTQPGEETENQDQENDQDESEDSQNEDGSEEEGSQPKRDELTKNVERRLAKEKTKQYAIQAELDKERADKAALQAQLDARPVTPAPQAPIEPNASDLERYPEGRDDPAFIKADKAFTQHETEQRIFAKIDQRHQQTTQTQRISDMKIRLKEAEDKHYERAGESNVENYLETEKRAINIIGRDIADSIIMDFAASQDLLFHLGDNPEKAREVFEMFKQGNPVKGVRELTRLESKLTKQPKFKNIIPEPDAELEGASPAGGANERKLDKLREEAARTGKMDKLLAFKKQLRERNKT